MVDFYEGKPVMKEKFELVELNKEFCEVVEYLAPYRQISAPDLVTGPDSCLRYCSHQDNCKLSMYDAKTNDCFIAVKGQLIDDTLQAKRYWEEHEWIVYQRILTLEQKKRGAGRPLTIQGGKCSQLCPGQCKKEKECGVDRGRFPENDKLQGCSRNMYCGRTGECDVFSSKKKV
ncbi:MAG: PAN domain-containing protein [Promethearchaeota archaeon]